jgi:DTW domain-containing protein YfiP
MIHKRLLCSKCHLAAVNCICKLVVPVNNLVEVLVLQHTKESAEVKNTIRLLNLCAQNIQIMCGEKFDSDELSKNLYHDQKIPLLLYPETKELAALGLLSPAEFPDLSKIELTKIRLVLIDATWKKSRKMLYLNPALQNLPRLTLQNIPDSLYSIRKAHSQNQLSSLEACCYAWRQFENNPSAHSELLTAFVGFVEQQRGFVDSVKN